MTSERQQQNQPVKPRKNWTQEYFNDTRLNNILSNESQEIRQKEAHDLECNMLEYVKMKQKKQHKGWEKGSKGE